MSSPQFSLSLSSSMLFSIMSSPQFSLSLSSSMLFSITLSLIVVYAPLLVSPSPQNLHHPTSTHGFTSALKHVDSDKNMTKMELLQLAAKRGRERMQSLESLPTNGVTFASRIQQLNSGYSMNLSIGTPKQLSFTAIIDTGSDLIWTLCKPYFKNSTPIFDPQKSSSYYKLNCDSDLCQALDSEFRNCSKCGDQCMYKYQYDGGKYTGGVFSTETFIFERKISVPKLGFGCAYDIHGNFVPNQGFVGLGWGHLSLVSQMKEAKFSYCLPKFGSSELGIISVGSVATTPRGAKTTPLIQNSFLPSFYYLSLQDITIGNVKLYINKTKLEIKKNGEGGLLIDSGTTLTYLEKSAFVLVRKELTHQLNLPSFDGTNTDFDLELCYNITRPMNEIKFPNIIFHFQGRGADFEVIPANYFAILDDEGKVGCLAMATSFYADGTSIFGNYQQQNSLVVYDLDNKKLVFKPNTHCDHK